MPLKIHFPNQIEVLESGTLIQFNQESILFELTGNTGGKIIVDVRFINSIENSETRMTFEDGGENHLIMNLINFGNKIGHGNTDAMAIGTFDNKELFFSYRVTSGNETFPRTFEYTFYTGKEVKNV